jgi:hypothetical protein
MAGKRKECVSSTTDGGKDSSGSSLSLKTLVALIEDQRRKLIVLAHASCGQQRARRWNEGEGFPVCELLRVCELLHQDGQLVLLHPSRSSAQPALKTFAGQGRMSSVICTETLRHRHPSESSSPDASEAEPSLRLSADSTSFTSLCRSYRQATMLSNDRRALRRV